MENDMRGIHPMATIIKKKGELANDVERYALTELQKEERNAMATIQSLNCKYLPTP
jgi:hypothetical protein